VRPLPPSSIEAIARAVPTDPDRVLIYLVAYAGLRPEEALALQWLHVRKTTILVEQKNVDGSIEVGQKTSRPPRAIDLASPLAADLAAYRMSLGRPHDTAYLLSRPDGHPWREHDYRNWRRRVFRPAAAKAGLATAPPWTKHQPYEGPRPYALRHSFASLRIHEGALSVAELAEQMGHSVQTLLGTYTHVIAEFKGQRKVPAETAIKRARAAAIRLPA
jgi:integrase